MNSLPNACNSTTCIQGIFIVGALDPHPSLVLQLTEIIMPPPLKWFSIKEIENTQPCWSEVETSLNLLSKVNTDVNNEIDCTHEHK